ncbi:hypothetical protein MNBD_GAMMA07-1689 [hydrothermal vent metagenome]|uniref:FHA domain-containing protein n=1 Tax=hydrothermal vent metagenome TaxID=652676 RepID=A0A3B0WVV1_9ZZZZ
MARIIQTSQGKVTRQYLIREEHVSIGRSNKCFIHINEKFISSKHAEIITEEDHHGNKIYFLMDLNSKNGSYINKNKVGCRQLKHKDNIRFGHQFFIFIDDTTEEHEPA